MAEKEVRKVKKEDKKENKKALNMVPVVTAVLGVLFIVIFLILIMFRVSNLQIEGNKRVDDAEIKNMIGYENCHGNSLLLWLQNRRVDVSGSDMVSDVRVQMIGPRTIRVKVEEQIPVGGINLNGVYAYFNENGMVIMVESAPIGHVPGVTGAGISEAELGEYVVAEDESLLSGLLTVASCLSNNDLESDEIICDAKGHFTVKCGKITVELGRNTNMEEKISEYKDIAAKLEGLSGTLHLENYDSGKDSIIFTKD